MTRMGPKPRPVRERVMSKFAVDSTGCWLWTSTRGSDGYGKIMIGSKADGSNRMHQAHRVVYELLEGQIPAGLDLDHLCRVRHCVNPVHLEPVTRGENLRRGIGFPATRARQTHCIHGHPFDEANTYRAPNGTRKCRECKKQIKRRAYAAAKAARRAALLPEEALSV